jgi:CHAD domain-containing protein
LAADAPDMAADFARAASASAWMRADARRADLTFAGLIALAQEAFWNKAAPLAERLADLTHVELHQLRKAVKAMRYGAELAASAGLGDNVVPRLKRIQDVLGYANDTAALERFNPPVFGEADAYRRVQERLVAERQIAVADAITAAMREWRALTPTMFTRAPAN